MLKIALFDVLVRWVLECRIMVLTVRYVGGTFGMTLEEFVGIEALRVGNWFMLLFFWFLLRD